MDREKLGGFIAQRRKERNLTQRELADAIHVTDKAVSKWERGVGCPDISLLEPLAEALDLSVDQLLTCRLPVGRPEQEAPAPTSQAVQAVLDLTLAQRRAHRQRRWIITLAAALTIVVLGVLCAFLRSQQIQGNLFIDMKTTSPDGNITVVSYSSGWGQQAVVVKNPYAVTDDGSRFGYRYTNAKVTEFGWSADSAYLALEQCYTRKAGDKYTDCQVWRIWDSGGGQWRGEKVSGSMRLLLAHLWAEGDTVLRAALSDVSTVQPSGYPVFDVSIDRWDGSVLQVKCTYSGTDGSAHEVLVRYDIQSRQVVSAA